MKKEKIYNLRLFEEEIDYLMAAVMDKTLSFEGKKSDQWIDYEKLDKKYTELFQHLSLVLRYQGDENDRTN